MKRIDITITSDRDDIEFYIREILQEMKAHDEIDSFIIKNADREKRMQIRLQEENNLYMHEHGTANIIV